MATPDYATLTAVAIEWSAAGAGEIVYVDGLREYIGATTTRGRGETLSNGEAVVLDDATESSLYRLNPVEDYLSVGRYLGVIRAKDTDQIGTDNRNNYYNQTDAKRLNEENDAVSTTLFSTFTYYVTVFDIADSSSGDNCYISTTKRTTTENTIFVDYILIIPIGDGYNLPQDLAHSSLRGVSPRRRLCER